MARTGAIVCRWGPAVRGREAKSLEVFGDALKYWEELAKEGRIIAHREYFSTMNNGGFAIIEGLVPELQAMMSEDEYLRLNMRAENIVEDFCIELYLGGSDQTVSEMTAMFLETLNDLGVA